MSSQQKRTVGDYRKKKPRQPRKKLERDFGPYNKAAERKIRHLWALLAHLSSLIGQPEQTGRGRPKAALSDIFFACVLKVSTKMSFRDFNSFLELAYEMGLISSLPRWSTVMKYLRDPQMTEVFKAFVTISSLPCRQLETTFCADATGIATKTYFSWNDEKYGHTRGGTKIWIKMHLLIGTLTQVVVAADATEGSVHDQIPFPGMVATASKYYDMKELVADKGYVSRFNLELVNDLGAVPFIPFMSHHIVPLDSSGSIWDKMIRLYVFRQEEFDGHYKSPRAKVESSIAANKRLFDTSLMAKSFSGQVNETYCRLIAHNLTRLIHAFYELEVVSDVADFGFYEPIYYNSAPDGTLTADPTDAEHDPSNCNCPAHEGSADPFWILPGEMTADMTAPGPRDHRSSAAPVGTEEDYPDNVIYLFGKERKDPL